jgi:hypothetical protein
MKNYTLSLLLLLSLCANAQKQDNINTIPHILFWENKPVSYTLVNNELTIVAGEKLICSAIRM